MGFKRRFSAEVFLFSGFFLLFFLTSSGGFESGDAITRYATAQSWLAGRGGALPENSNLNNTTRGADGKLYGAYAPLQSMLMTPVLWFVNKLPLSDVEKDMGMRLLFNLILVPILSALALLVVFRALLEMGIDERMALLTVLVLGFATPLWHYSRTAQEENLVALGFALWLLGMACFQKGKSGGLFLATVGGAIALATRWASVASLIPLVAITLVMVFPRISKVKRELTLSVGFSLAVLGLLLWYNRLRFGSFFETGYGVMFSRMGMPLFSWEQFPGRVLALLFSPYRGLFLFAPVLGFLLFIDWKKKSLLEWSGLAALLAALVLNAGYSYWTAGHAWGPRFLVAPLILLGPLLADFLKKHSRSILWRSVLVVSIVVQVFSVLLPSSLEDTVSVEAGIDHLKLENAWKCEYSALCLRGPWAARAVRNTFTGIADRWGEGLNDPDFQAVFWWPLRFSIRLGSRPHPIAWALVILLEGLIIYVFLGAFRRAAPG